MSVSAELQKGSQQLEYFITIEGLGWPSNGLFGALSGGFDGDIFVTNDIAGDLDSQLEGTALTIHHGLELPSSVSESINPRDASYSPSGLSFTIVDHDDILREGITPRKSGSTTKLASSQPLTWQDEEIYLTDGSAFSTGDNVWIGGRELVQLGTKTLVSGSQYRYPDSVRGYLGTQRGSSLRRPEDYCLGYWPAGTTVYSVAWWWYNRQVALWAHVPGEAASQCSLRWYGRMRPITNPGAGIQYRFSCAGDFVSSTSRIRRAVDWQMQSTKLADGKGAVDETRDHWIYKVARGARRLLEFSGPASTRLGADGDGQYELAAAYQYRNVPGGIEGMVDSWDAGTVQARDTDLTDILHSYVYADDAAWLMISRETAESNTDPRLVRAEALSQAGRSRVAGAATFGGEAFAGGMGTTYGIAPHTPARFLLDNMHRGVLKGRFNLWGSANGGSRHTRHPIDVALMFMLSHDRELYRADTAAGSTATVVNVTTNAANDALIGKALFCMEGNSGLNTAPARQACPITDNDSSSITIEGGFSTAPNANLEVQVRNSIYDVLPLGWGMGIDSRSIDIDAFEMIRDESLPEVELGDFMLGVQDEIDIWSLIYDNILKPYGILVYFDNAQRKISAKYLGVTPTDGVFEDFVAIDREHIFDPGSVTHAFSNPVSSISLTVRANEQRVVGSRQLTNVEHEALGIGYGHATTSKVIRAQRAALMDGKTVTVQLKSEELNIAFAEHHLERLEMEALLNTEADFGALAGRLAGLVGEYSVPPPVWEPRLDIEIYDDLQLGSYVLINWNEFSAPANPFTGNRGWTDIVGRIIGRSYPLSSSPSFSVTIELLVANLTGRIAPAVVVTAKGSDGLGAYFECATAVASQNYVADPDNDKDWYKFAVGDELEHRDESGAVKASWTNRSITGFGTDESADPTTAPGSPMRIYLDGAIGSTVASGDYITLAAWPTSASSRRQRYSTYADANETIGPDADPARVYA